jgi:predicted dehydrogenase
MKIKFGLVGGGGISHNHILGATFDGVAEFTSGCFSRNEEKNRSFAKQYHLDTERVYEDYQTMADKESVRTDKIDFVIVCTPNASHYEICKAFLTKGIAVVCDKPLTTSTEQATELVEIAKKNDLICATTYTFGGFPYLHLAKDLYLKGEIGKAYFITCKYFRGARLAEIYADDIKTWRFTKSISGRAGAIGDLGTHVEYISRFLLNNDLSRLIANLITKPGKVEIDTTGTVILEYRNGLNGLITVAQAACGHDNDIEVEILGEKGTIQWSMKKYNQVKVDYLDGKSIIHRDPGVKNVVLEKFSNKNPLLVNPPVMGFINIYSGYSNSIVDKRNGLVSSHYFPTLEDGLKGVQFIDACIRSQENDNTWTSLID